MQAVAWYVERMHGGAARGCGAEVQRWQGVWWPHLAQAWHGTVFARCRSATDFAAFSEHSPTPGP
jgi:hypothetical protein